MALTAGLLTFLGVEALFEAFDRQALLPQGIGGAGLVLLGVALSYLGMTFLSSRLRSGGREAGGMVLAVLVALGIGVHNLGEGLAIGSSFAFGELQLGTFLIVGFMIHNVTEGLGIAAPVAEGKSRPGLRLLSLLARRRRSAGDSRRLDRRLHDAATCSACSSSPSRPAPRCRSSSRSAASSRVALQAGSPRATQSADSSQGSP